ncbi:hypothetical protein L208DRAFT_349558 [Tricholoma matsutake]|nr:hypothetical protein L208DRAFT_349558 [Tricholoma matsutake 945]
MGLEAGGVSLAPSSLSVVVGGRASYSGGSGAGRWWHHRCHGLHTHNPPYEQRLAGMGWVCWVVSCPAVVTSRVERPKRCNLRRLGPRSMQSARLWVVASLPVDYNLEN